MVAQGRRAGRCAGAVRPGVPVCYGRRSAEGFRRGGAPVSQSRGAGRRDGAVRSRPDVFPGPRSAPERSGRGPMAQKVRPAGRFQCAPGVAIAVLQARDFDSAALDDPIGAPAGSGDPAGTAAAPATCGVDAGGAVLRALRDDAGAPVAAQRIVSRRDGRRSGLCKARRFGPGAAAIPVERPWRDEW